MIIYSRYLLKIPIDNFADASIKQMYRSFIRNCWTTSGRCFLQTCINYIASVCAALIRHKETGCRKPGTRKLLASMKNIILAPNWNEDHRACMGNKITKIQMEMRNRFYRQLTRQDLRICSFHIQLLFDGNWEWGWKKREGGTVGISERVATTVLARRISLTRLGKQEKNALISQSPSSFVPGQYERCARKRISSRFSIFPFFLFYIYIFFSLSFSKPLAFTLAPISIELFSDKEFVITIIDLTLCFSVMEFRWRFHFFKFVRYVVTLRYTCCLCLKNY